MHRPLREPIYLRLWRLIRGVFLYNTVYWRKASDGLNLPTLSAEERERQRPERNLEIIRPRVRPRAHLDAAQAIEVSNLEAGAEVSEPPMETMADEQYAVSGKVVPRVYRNEVQEDGTEQVYVKRRRYRRRRMSRGSSIDRGGFFARVFGKK